MNDTDTNERNMTIYRVPVTIGLCCCFLIYLVINSNINMDPSAQFHQMLPVKASNNLAVTTGIADAIEHLVNTIDVANVSEVQVRKMVQEIGRKMNDYVAAKWSTNASVCRHRPLWRCDDSNSSTDLPVIYAITPTYRRPEQLAELTRLAQTLLHVPSLHWIVVEDSSSRSPYIDRFLARIAIPYTHLNAQMPQKYQKSKTKPRGVSNRNAALDWIRQNSRSGVVYFADDDNSYDVRIFEEMRYTKKVSMWPVGLLTQVGLSSPVVNKSGSVIDFFDGWMANRKFPVDMAGFAFNVKLLLAKPDAYMPYVAGHEEDGFLKQLDVSLADIEPKADLCSQLLVWHTQTKKNPLANRTIAKSSRYKGTNIDLLQEFIV